MAFLPDGRVLVTERPGRMRLIGKDGTALAAAARRAAGVCRRAGRTAGRGAGPDFAASGLIYFSYSEPRGRGSNGTSVARGQARGRRRRRPPRQREGDLPPGAGHERGGMHFGSRLAFARDGNLFVTLGERFTAATRRRTSATHLRQGRAHPPDGVACRPTIRSWASRLHGRRSGATATATCRPPPSIPRPASCGPWSTARAAATRSTFPKPARTTAGR